MSKHRFSTGLTETSSRKVFHDGCAKRDIFSQQILNKNRLCLAHCALNRSFTVLITQVQELFSKKKLGKIGYFDPTRIILKTFKLKVKRLSLYRGYIGVLNISPIKRFNHLQLRTSYNLSIKRLEFFSKNDCDGYLVTQNATCVAWYLVSVIMRQDHNLSGHPCHY